MTPRPDAQKDAQKDKSPHITVRRAAMNLLARREQSFQELLQKLVQKYPDIDRTEIIVPALEKLRQENLQSDERFVEAYVRYRQTRGMGPLKIAVELGQKGVDDALVQQELYSGEIDWQQACRAALERKFMGRPVGDIKEREKRYRFLSQRGFGGEQIRAVLGDL